MLFYRPILAAYRTSRDPAIRRFLLREIASPLLHSDPEESLASLREVDARRKEPMCLAAEVSLLEQRTRLRLTTRNPVREFNGHWTRVAGSSARSEIAPPVMPRAEILRAADSVLGPVITSLLDGVTGEARDSVLISLGYMSPAFALDPLRSELKRGERLAAAGFGLSLVGTESAGLAFASAVEVRKLGLGSAWLGVALQGLASDGTLPLLDRLMRSSEPHVREQGAIALEAFGPFGGGSLLNSCAAETSPLVRLNLLRSLGRIDAPVDVDTLGRFVRAGDPEILKITATRAAGLLRVGDVQPYLAEVLRSGNAAERAEALEALAGLPVAPERYLAEALAATTQTHNRLYLTGLLALVAWDPHQAFARIQDALRRGSASQWYCATYALRYLKVDLAPVLLIQLSQAARGKELEEIAVSSLARHLHRPRVVEALLDQASPGTHPLIVRRIMEDLGRHLMPGHAHAVAQTIRDRLPHVTDPRYRGPMLVGLGALGTSSDLDRLLDEARGPVAPDAIHAVELLADRAACPALEILAREAKGETRDAAILAMFRLGSLGAVNHVKDLSRSPDGRAAAARLVVEMGIAVRHAATLPRLLALHEALATLAPPTGSPEGNTQSEPVHSSTSQPSPIEQAPGPAQGGARDDGPQARLHAAVERRPTVRAGAIVVQPGVPPAEGSAQLYRDLGQHLLGPGLGPRGARWPLVVAGCIAMAALIGGADRLLRPMNQRTVTGHRAAAPPSRAPLLAQDGRRPAHPVEAGDLVGGPPIRPVVLRTPIAENQLILNGTLRVLTLERRENNSKNMEMSAELLEGELDVALLTGSSRVRIEACMVAVEINRGHVRSIHTGDTLQVMVQSGQARVMSGERVLTDLIAPAAASFRTGALVGRGGASPHPGSY